MDSIYCLQCRDKTDTVDAIISISKNDRHMKRGKCVECGTNKCSFCKKPSMLQDKSDESLDDLIDDIIDG